MKIKKASKVNKGRLEDKSINVKYTDGDRGSKYRIIVEKEVCERLRLSYVDKYTRACER